MDGILQTVIVVFMAFLCALCLFAVVVIVRDIISENASTKRSRERNRMLEEAILREQMLAVKPKEEAPVVSEPVSVQPQPAIVEPIKEEVAVTVEEPTSVEEADNAVVFQTKAMTMQEKYDALTSEFKGYFNRIVKYVSSKEGVKEFKFNSAYDYKIGSYRVLRLSIKRGEIVCEFVFIDRDLRDYVNTSNIKMKQSATAVRVLEASAVGVIKDGIDRVCAQIAEDKEFKKEQARERRREKRRQAKEENA